MKNIFILIFVFAFFNLNAQFKDQDTKLDIKGGILNGTPGTSLFGFINPNNFSMKHSIGLSYSTFGGNAISMGVYTNSMEYKFSDKFNIQVDASLVNSPYSTFGDNFAKQINGIYLSKAQLNYQPTEDVNIMFRFSQLPYTTSYDSYGFNRFSSFNDDFYFGR